jgi:capsular polysaccharide biosynthesis protein
MTSINSTHHLTRIKIAPSRVWVIPAVLFITILGIGGLALRFFTTAYQAESSVEIQLPRLTDLSLPQAYDWVQSGELLPSQSRVVRSPEFLGEFAQKASLSERWSLTEPETLALLQQSLRVVESPETHTMLLQFTSIDQNEAVELVNGLGQAFAEHWRKTQNNGARIEVIKLAKDLLTASEEIRAEGLAMLKSLDAEVAAILEATQGLESTQARVRELDAQLALAYRQSEALQLTARFTQPATTATTVASAGPLSPTHLLSLAVFAFLAAGGAWGLQNRKRSAIRARGEASPAINQVHLPTDKPIRAEKPETLVQPLN